MTSSNPVVSNGSLLLTTRAIDLDSPEWWEWLDQPEACGFRYVGAEPFTARREERPGGHYWYGHRRLEGKLAKIYIGRSGELTHDRLAQSAHRLAKRRPHEALTPDPVPERDGADMLPAQANGLIGRDEELHAAAALLTAETRLLTLIGPGGAGKTRLAIAVGEALTHSYAQGVTFVDLVPTDNCETVARAIAQALHLREARGRTTTQLLEDTLRNEQRLLVLDNFEHVLGAATLVAHLLETCPKLAVLATSREALRVRWEHILAVPPLGTSPAVALFARRARAVASDFELTDDNLGAVTEICIRLDGLPLAIELAAARSNVLPPRAILERLDRGLDFLQASVRDMPERHRALRTTIAWSYDTLAEDARRLFRLLAVFEGTCSLEAIEALWGGGASSCDVFDALGSLIDKSLVQRVPHAVEARFRLLQTIREYALELATAAGEMDGLRRQHAGFYVELAHSAEPHLTGREQSLWLERLEAELGNVRGALRWATSSNGDPNVGMRLAGSLWRFWSQHGYFTEGIQWLSRALDRSVGLPPTELATGLFGAAQLLARRGDGDLARTRCDEALALYRELEDAAGIAGCLNTLGNLAFDAAQYDAARAYYEETVRLQKQLGDRRGIAVAVCNLGNVAYCQGDFAAAEPLYDENLAIRREIQDAAGTARGLVKLAATARAQGQMVRAATLVRDALTRLRELGDRWSYAECFEMLADVADAAEEPARAARLLGAGDALRTEMQVDMPPADRSAHTALVANVRGALAGEFAGAFEEGRRMPLDQAIDFALTPVVIHDRATLPEEARPATDDVPLTGREREIAALIAQGRSNREIGAALVIADGTAARHVANILRKLGFSSRAQIAAWAVQHAGA